ncbi:MAG: substrate-binding periplasmic protein [Acidobacteriota bacterium]
MHPPTASAGPLTILTEEFPPYNYTEDGHLRGISTDILLLMLAEAGMDIPVESFQVLPWSRGYNDVLSRPNTLLFSVTRTAERETLFKWIGPIAPNRNVLLARKDRDMDIRDFSQVMHLRIGAIRDDAGEQLLVARGYPLKWIDVTSDARSNILKLETGRIDLFAYPETVFKWLMAQSRKNADEYETVFVLHEGHLYFAVNRDTPDETVRKLQEALDALKESGKVQDIIEGYLR